MSNNSTIHSSGKRKTREQLMWWDKVERKEKNPSGFGAQLLSR
jgi:hypothetical protein